MGLFSDTYNSYDYTTRINFPDTIKVHEHKAPTDESIKLMESMHQKVLENLISKVKVDNNLVKGEAFFFDQPINLDGTVKMVFKFKINEREFVVEKELSYFDLGIEDRKSLHEIQKVLKNSLEAIVVWYCLRSFSIENFEKITGNKMPEYLLR